MLRRFSGGVSESWIRVAEHGILRAVSLAFSLASAYAIRVFFAPLDAADPGERVITWVVAAGFGVLGYVVSRGLVHRMMHKESIWAYAPICALVELVDISCNYVLAASVVRQAWWLSAVPENQRGVLTAITYVVLSAIPLVSLFLAVVDMDLERSKNGSASTGGSLAGKTKAQPLTLRASQMGNSGSGGSGLTKSGGTTNKESGTAAKRATYWSNQQTRPIQPSSQASSNPMTYDPDKDLAGAGVP